MATDPDDSTPDRINPDDLGQREQLDRLYRKYRACLTRFAARSSVRSCDPDDLVHQAFLNVHKRGFVYTSDEEACFFLKQQIIWVIRGEYRKQNGSQKSSKSNSHENTDNDQNSLARPRAATTGADSSLWADSAQVPPLDQLIAQELWDEVEELPVKLRESIKRRFQLDDTAQETADVIGSTANTVAKYRQAGIKQLREMLKE